MDDHASTRRSALAPDHLSLYALTLDDPDAEGLTGPDGDHLPTRRGARRVARPGAAGQDEDRAAAMYHYAVVRLAEDGWHGYEICNWARPGHESRHNLAYWRRLPYEAVGPGAHAFDGLTRRWNAARLDGYVAALTPPDGRRPVAAAAAPRTLDPADAASEALILACARTMGWLPPRWTIRPSPRRSSGRARSSCVDRRPGRPGPPHDPRPAPLQRAVRPADLTAEGRAAGARPPPRDPSAR